MYLTPPFFLGIYLSRDVPLLGYNHIATYLKQGSPLGGRCDLTSSTAATWWWRYSNVANDFHEEDGLQLTYKSAHSSSFPDMHNSFIFSLSIPASSHTCIFTFGSTFSMTWLTLSTVRVGSEGGGTTSLLDLTLNYMPGCRMHGKLELCRAHTSRAHCNLAIDLLLVHGYNFVKFREIMEMLLTIVLGIPVTLERALSEPRLSPD